MNARLALALLVAMVTAVPASGAANLRGESNARASPMTSAAFLRSLPLRLPPRPICGIFPRLPAGLGGFLPLSLPYQRPWVN